MIKALIPIVDMYIKNIRLKDTNFRYSDIEVPDDIENRSHHQLEKDYYLVLENKNSIENQAKTIEATLLIVMVLVLNIVYFINTLVMKGTVISWINYVTIGLSIISIIYLLFAEIIAIQILIKENGVYDVRINSKSDLFRAIQQNKNQNIIRENMIKCVYLSIRNAFICFALIFGLTVFYINM